MPITEHFNGLTPEEQERLSILLEEMGEAIQVIGKIQRHGYNSTQTKKPYGATNRELLEKELGDVFVAFEMLRDSMDINNGRIIDHMVLKRDSIKQFLHHNK